MNNPAVDINGNQYWYNGSGQHHREDGPAIIYANGEQVWCINGKWHKTDGPAFIWSGGLQEWFVNGYCYSDNKSFQKAADLSDEDMLAIILKYGDVK